MKLNNQELLRQPLGRRQIELISAFFLNKAPATLPTSWDFKHVEGMLLGLAIGDVLGNTMESLGPAARRKSHGEIHDYLPNHNAEYSRSSGAQTLC